MRRQNVSPSDLLEPAEAGSDTTTWQIRASSRIRVLFVASTGGHLSELDRLIDYRKFSDASQWITFDSSQSRSLLAGRAVLYTAYVAPRDVVGVVRTFLFALRNLDRSGFDVCVSTGAGITLGIFPWARLSGIPCIYIESLARSSAPSLTGRLVRRLRLGVTFSQNDFGNHWPRYRSALSRYRRIDSVSRTVTRVLVTLGTIAPYRFDALVDAVLSLRLTGVHFVWQVGATNRDDLPGTTVDMLTEEEFLAEARRADVVVSHAGVGTILSLLELGTCPLVVPRTASRGEHVDDHQREICEALMCSDLAVVVGDPERLGDTELRQAASSTIVAEDA